MPRKKPATRRAIRRHCLNATKSRRDALQAIAVRYVRVTDVILERCGGLEGLWFIDRHRCIRDAWAAMGCGDRFGLQGRCWKQALNDAFGALKSLWGNAISVIERKVARSRRFSPEQKRYLFYRLLYPSLLYDLARDDAFCDINVARPDFLAVRRTMCLQCATAGQDIGQVTGTVGRQMKVSALRSAGKRDARLRSAATPPAEAPITAIPRCWPRTVLAVLQGLETASFMARAVAGEKQWPSAIRHDFWRSRHTVRG